MKWTHWALYGVTLPWDLLVAWPVVLLIRVFWGEDLRWETPPPYDRLRGGGGGPCLTCRIRVGSFPVVPGTWPRGWYLHPRTKRPWGGTTLGHAIFYGPGGRGSRGVWTRTQAHEHVHVEQAEVVMLGSFFVGLITGIVVSALGQIGAGAILFSGIWMTGYLMMGFAGWVTAWLRGEEAYWGSTHEESARAQTEQLLGR